MTMESMVALKMLVKVFSNVRLAIMHYIAVIKKTGFRGGGDPELVGGAKLESRFYYP
jgi:hypothetical protein